MVSDPSMCAILQVLPAVADILAPASQLVLLIKPQFEATRSQARSKHGTSCDFHRFGCLPALPMLPYSPSCFVRTRRFLTMSRIVRFANSSMSHLILCCWLRFYSPQLLGCPQVSPGGIVRDAAVHDEVIGKVTAGAAELGFLRQGVIESPIRGAASGNTEFLAHFVRSEPPACEQHAS